MNLNLIYEIMYFLLPASRSRLFSTSETRLFNYFFMTWQFIKTIIGLISLKYGYTRQNFIKSGDTVNNYLEQLRGTLSFPPLTVPQLTFPVC